MATDFRPLTRAAFRRLARPLLALPVSRVWQSFAWSLFLELGKLTWEPYPKKMRKRGSWRGEAGLMLDAGWRIERKAGIVADFKSARADMNRAVRSLNGRRVEGIDVEGRLPEISIRLSGGLWVRSLTVALEETQWTLFLKEGSKTSVWLTAKGSGLIREIGF